LALQAALSKDFNSKTEEETSMVAHDCKSGQPEALSGTRPILSTDKGSPMAEPDHKTK
jgi:hypothetical protein